MQIRRREVLAGGAAVMMGGPTRAISAEPGVDARTLQIGQAISLQGGRNDYAVDVLAGVQALFDDVNRGGGVHGRRLALSTLDDDGRADTAEAHARQLLRDGAFILFGSVEGGPSTAVMKVAHEHEVPFLGPMAGSPTLRRPHQPMVFPVRAEHRDEFRALVDWGRSTGLKRVALLHADTEVGRQHLDNVQKIAAEAGIEFGGGLPFSASTTEATLDAALQPLERQRVDMLLNHGSPLLYEKLIRRARARGSRITFFAVNSGSTQMAAALGPLARHMVFAQVVPNPFSGKVALVREYQQRFARLHPGRAFSYGSLEGYMTAKLAVIALQQAGPAPTRAGLLRALEAMDVDLGGVRVRYRKGDHAGSNFVDLTMVGSDGRFVQ